MKLSTWILPTAFFAAMLSGVHAQSLFGTIFFNAWNPTQFQQFANNISTAAFGTWNSAREARIIQFGLKVIY